MENAGWAAVPRQADVGVGEFWQLSPCPLLVSARMYWIWGKASQSGKKKKTFKCSTNLILVHLEKKKK